MALDATLGNGKAHAASTVTITTTNPIAAGSLIFHFAALFGSTTTYSTPTSLGLTWTIVPGFPATSGNLRMYCWWALDTAGRASGASLSATASSATDLMATAIALSGRDTSGPITASNSSSGTAAAWSSGNLAAAAGDDLLAAVFEDGDGAATNTETSPAVEFADFNDATQTEAMAAEYKLGVSAGTTTVAGTWSSAPSFIAGGVAVKAAAAAAVAPASASRLLPRMLGPRAVGPMFFVPLARAAAADAVTLISDSDAATASETSDVQATVPGSDSSTESEAGTVSATVPGSDAGTGSEAGTVTATVPGSDSGASTETGTASVTTTGSDTGASSEAATASVTASSSDAGTASDASQLTVIPPDGSDSGTGTEGGSVAMSGSGSDATAVTDAGLVAATVPGSDSATATDDGTVVDLGGVIPISGSDSATTIETGTVVDITPPTPPVDTGGGGIVDETSIYGDFRALTGEDAAVAFEFGVVVDLTPPEPPPPLPRLKLPPFRRRVGVREIEGQDAARTGELATVGATAGGRDSATAREGWSLQIIDPDEEDALERRILSDLGLSDL